MNQILLKPDDKTGARFRAMAKYRGGKSLVEYLAFLVANDTAETVFCAKCGAPILDLREFTVLSGEVKITCPGCKFESVLKHANEIE